jgi:hypothetical protein
MCNRVWWAYENYKRSMAINGRNRARYAVSNMYVVKQYVFYHVDMSSSIR